MWGSILENLLIVVLTILFLLGGGYLLLLVLGWGLKLKSGGREQAGLTDLWIETQKLAQSENNSENNSDTQD